MRNLVARPPEPGGLPRFNMGRPEMRVKGSTLEVPNTNGEEIHDRSSISMSGKPLSEASFVIKRVQPFSTAAAR